MTEDLAAQLADTIRDLDGYIERRANEIAAPRIAEVEARAATEIEDILQEAAVDRRRREDSLDELRRHVEAAHRHRARLEEENGRLRAQVSPPSPSGT